MVYVKVQKEKFDVKMIRKRSLGREHAGVRNVHSLDGLI